MGRFQVSRRRPVLVAAVLVPIPLLAAAYFLFFTPSSPDRLGVSSTAGDSGASTAPVPLSGDVEGTWKPSPDSVVGYRVRERLARLPASSDAVGRTSAVVGSVTVKREGRRSLSPTRGSRPTSPSSRATSHGVTTVCAPWASKLTSTPRPLRCRGAHRTAVHGPVRRGDQSSGYG